MLTLFDKNESYEMWTTSHATPDVMCKHAFVNRIGCALDANNHRTTKVGCDVVWLLIEILIASRASALRLELT